LDQLEDLQRVTLFFYAIKRHVQLHI